MPPSSSRRHDPAAAAVPAPAPDASGSAQAFDALVRAHYARLYNFAYRMLGTRDAAEDAVQEIFLWVWDHRSEVQLRDPLPYLYQALRNRCLMALRRTRRWREVDFDTEDEAAFAQPAGATVGTTTAIEAADLEAALGRAIEELPERCRLVFTMSREQDLTYAEIAAVLGISPKTVENQIGRALKLLRRRLAGFLGVAVALFSISA
jgi:RNA polymerase sigma-70 factor (ECF subfamily)